MKSFLLYFSVAIFSIFIGSQITEGALLVPYWQSLSSAEFYAYYAEFGPGIGKFYTVLTIVAALLPVGIAIYAKRIDAGAFKLALASSFFAVLFITCFYVYFKGTNELFYQAAFSEAELKAELVTWSCWHWGRVGIEFASLVFLMLSLRKLNRS
jgi:hypothetical protein